jgi:hypothetical protein
VDSFYNTHEKQYHEWMVQNQIPLSHPLIAREYFSSRMFQYRDMEVVADQSSVTDMSHALHNYYIGGLSLNLM